MRKSIALVTVLVLCVAHALAAASARATYVGGSITLAEKTDGRFDLAGADAAVFKHKKGELTVPYAGIDSVEYGQKAGRRVGAAVVVSPLFLLSKKRKHYVTLSFTDTAGAKQGAVFEVAKSDVHELVTTLCTKSGKQVEYESEDARKNLEKEGR